MPEESAPPVATHPLRRATDRPGSTAPAVGAAAAKEPAVIPKQLIILTGMSGAGKQSALRALEDLGYYSVDNLPLELLPQFAELVRSSNEIYRAAIGVDVREGLLDRFPKLLKKVRQSLPTTVMFLEATDDVLVRRYSETRRPHPLGREEGVLNQIRAERLRLETIRNVADVLLDTTRFNVHELRAHVTAQFSRDTEEQPLLLSMTSFGFKNGVPPEADLIFDVRFLPNPHFIPEFRHKTGQDKRVADYVKSFPQTGEFLDRTTDMLLFLLPHYVKEGKSYLTIAMGCTGGQHRSVAMAEELSQRLAIAGYRVKTSHRDMQR